MPQPRKIVRLDVSPPVTYPSIIAAVASIPGSYTGLRNAIENNRFFFGTWQYLDKWEGDKEEHNPHHHTLKLKNENQIRRSPQPRFNSTT